jgi:hypothetical protein
MQLIKCEMCDRLISPEAIACPQCGHPHRVIPNLPPRRVAAMVAMSWAPALVLACSLPQFVPTFDRWPRGQELPALTLALMSVGRLGVWPIVLTGLTLVAVLALGCAGCARAGLPGNRAATIAIGLVGIGLMGALFWGVLGPMALFRAPM